MKHLASDFRLALRGLRRSPLFASVAILSLGLGIGANTAIFTLIDQLLLRNLPVRAPHELVMLYQEGAHNGSNLGTRMHSYPIYQDYRRAEPLSEVLSRRLLPASVSVDGHTERVSAEIVSGNYFSMLGVHPAAGRVFNSREDDQVYGGHPVVVLSYDYWVSRFARDRGVVGRKILVNDYPMTVVGVSAAGFSGIDPAQSPQIRVPILMKDVMLPEWEWLEMANRRHRWVQVFARLKPGFTAESAGPALQALFTRVRTYEMTLPAAKDWTAFDRAEFMKGRLHVERAAVGYSDLRNAFSTALLVLMCMVGLVLLIACANVANLLIARGFMRQKEIAVRISLGASRGRLVGQLLVESLVLALMGGVLGVFLAIVLTRGLLALVPSSPGSPILISATPDVRVLGFTLALTALTGVIFGLVPALRASRPDPWTTLKDTIGSIAGAGGSLFLRKGLVTAQVALSFLLLFGAGLFVRSLQNLKGTDPGVALDNLVTFQLNPALNGYDDQRAGHLFEEVLERLQHAPGVQSAGLAAVPILAGSEWDSTMSVEGHKAADGEDMQAFMNAVSPGYFATMRIPVLEGRDFRSTEMHPDARVAIVNKRFADHFFRGHSAVGRRLGWGDGPDAKLDIEIIGVVANSLYEGPREGVRRQVFVPRSGNGSAAVYVRTDLPSPAAYTLVRHTVRTVDAALPVYELKTLEGQLDETLLADRLVALLAGGFGLLATLLASIGLYGVMAFVVTRRRKELGIRLALGAQPGAIVWLVMKEVVVLLAVGLVVGVPAAIALGRVVSSQLYGIRPHDPEIAVATVVLLALVSGAAGAIPARRASRTDPVLALRYE